MIPGRIRPDNDRDLKGDAIWDAALCGQRKSYVPFPKPWRLCGEIRLSEDRRLRITVEWSGDAPQVRSWVTQSIKRMRRALRASVFSPPPLKFRTAGFPQYGFKREFDHALRAEAL